MSEWIICLGGSINQVPYIKEIRKMNYKILLLDKNKDAPGIKLSSEYKCIGYDEISKLEDLIRERFIFSNKVKHIFSAASQFSHIGVSTLSELLDFKFISKKYILGCLDKKIFYKVFEKLLAPIPKTELICNYEELKNFFLKSKGNYNWYLKSDCGKSPNYIYRLNKENLHEKKIFWGKDRYLSEGYLLQKEFLGQHIRVNIFKNSFCMFDHSNNKMIDDLEIINRIREFQIFQKLVEIQSYFNFEKFICKFDIIVNKSGWVVIDIGIDPPSRIKSLYLKNKINFFKLFVQITFGEEVYLPFFQEI